MFAKIKTYACLKEFATTFARGKGKRQWNNLSLDELKEMWVSVPQECLDQIQ
jgi:hypothetical protein